MAERHSVQWLQIVVAAAAVTCGPSAVYGDTYEVTLEGISFWFEGQADMDIDLSILPGDTVRWIWVEGYHNVVSGFPGDPNGGDLFDSGPPTDPPMTFEFTFLDPGIYGYHCHPHEQFGMISQVTVTPAPGSLALLAAGGLLANRRRRRSYPAG